MYSPQPPQQQPPYQPPAYGQGPFGQPPYGQPPYGQPSYGQPPKDPTVGLLLELIGFVGFLGIGWIWAGETATGVALLVGWLIFLPIYYVICFFLMFIVIGFCLLPLPLLVPIISGVVLMNRLKARQAAVQFPTAY
jgi:hypothetical protein